MKDRKNFFLLKEIAGSLGDLPLFFIFLIAFHQFSNLNPLAILFWSGLAHIIVGLIFKVPLPYQPMKAIGLYAIAHGVSQADVLSAGFILGALILALNYFKLFEGIYRIVPEAVIRGIQVGLAIKLFQKSFDLLSSHTGALPWLELLGAVVIIILFFKRYHFILILAIFGLTIPWSVAHHTFDPITFQGLSSLFQFHLPSFSLSETVLTLIVIQLPLTTANSIFSPALLLKDYFPEKKIKISSLATSVGLINLLTCPFGGMPACHGAGGLAAQVRFGARTGVSMIVLGVVKMFSALFLGSFFYQMATQFPKTLLALLFIFPGFELCTKALKLKGWISSLTLILTGGVYVFWHAGWAMLIGVGIYYGIFFLQKMKKSEAPC